MNYLKVVLFSSITLLITNLGEIQATNFYSFGTGSFTTSTNWTPNKSDPLNWNNDDEAFINNAQAHITSGNTVNFNYNSSIDSNQPVLIIGVSDATQKSNVYIDSGGTLTNSGVIAISLVGISDASLSLINSGILNNNSKGIINNNSLLINQNNVNNLGNINNNSSGFIINLDKGSFINNLSILSNGSIINNNQTTTPGSTDISLFQNAPNAILTNNGSLQNLSTANFINSGDLENNGTIANSAVTVTIGSLTTGGFSNSAILNNKSGSTLTNSGSFYNNTSLTGTINTVINNSGVINNSNNIINDNSNNTFLQSIINNKISSVINNSGTIHNNTSAALNNAGDIENTGKIYANASPTSGVPTGGFYNTNLVNNNSGGVINVGGYLENAAQFNNNSGSSLSISGIFQNDVTSTMANVGGITNSGTLKNLGLLTSTNSLVNTGTFTNFASGSFTNSGFFTNSIGSVFSNAGLMTNAASGVLNNGGSFANTGTIFNNGQFNFSTNFTNNGTYKGTGLFNGGLFVNQGTVNPGNLALNSVGTMAINGAYNEQNRLQIAISSLASYDVLAVQGALSLLSGSNLEVDLLNSFHPQLGNIFDIVAYNSTLSGVFSSLNLPVLNSGLAWEVIDNAVGSQYGDYPNSIALEVVAAPEPTTYLLLASFLLLIGYVKTQRQKKWISESVLVMSRDFLQMKTRDEIENQGKQ